MVIGDQLVTVTAVVTTATGDVTLTLGELLESIEVTSAVGEASTWTLVVAGHSGEWVRSPLGWEVTYNGAPPPGLLPVEIEMTVSTAGAAAVASQLVTNGKTNDSNRLIAAEGHLMTLAGMGPEIRYDKALVSLQLAPEHSETHGEIIETLALQAGVPAGNIQLGALGYALDNPVEVANEEWLSIARDIGQAVNVDVGFDHDGDLVSWPLAPTSGTPVATLAEADIVTGGGVTITAVSEVPTCVTVEGSRVELPPGSTGSNTTTEIVETTDPAYAIRGAHWVQQADGTLAAPTPGPVGDQTPAALVVERITTERTTTDGCITREVVITEQYHNFEAARYTQDATGGIQAAHPTNVYIMDAGATTDDGAAGYTLRYDQFGEVSRVQTDYTYDGNGLLTRTEIRQAGIYNPRAALEARAAPSGTYAYTNGVRLTGGGDGVLNVAATYHNGPNDPDPNSPTSSSAWLTLEVIDRTNTADNYLERSLATRSGFRLLPTPPLYRYRNGEEAGLPNERAGDTGQTDTRYQADESTVLTTIETETDQNGDVVENGQKITTTQGAYLPAATICNRDTLLRSSSTPISSKATLEGEWDDLEVVVQSDWIETAASALAMAERLQREAAAITVTLPLMARPDLRKLDRVTLDMPRFGLTGDGWIESISHSAAPVGQAAQILTTVVVKVPVS